MDRKTQNSKYASQNTILVTGGAGYIGSFTVKELLDNGFDVVVLDSLETGHREAVDPRAKLEVCDLANPVATAEVFEKYRPKAVIDFAAYLAVGESMENPQKYLENNVINFIKLLDVIVSRGCKLIIKSSTAATYGDPRSEDDFPLKENYQEKYWPEESELLPGKWNGTDVEKEKFFQKFIGLHKEKLADRPELALTNEELTRLRIPTSIYGLTKLLDEIILAKYSETSGINYVALRYFNVCGAAIDGKMGDAKPNPTNLMTLVIYNALGKIDLLKVFGNDFPTKDGTGVRDYIHPLDLATGHLAALNYLLRDGKSNIFNLGNGSGYSVLEVIKSVENASGKTVKYDVMERRSGDPAISIADPSKAREILDWKAKYNLGSMAETAWKWHSQHPMGYAGSIKSQGTITKR